jgi:hypothetical protein
VLTSPTFVQVPERSTCTWTGVPCGDSLTVPNTVVSAPAWGKAAKALNSTTRAVAASAVVFVAVTAHKPRETASATTRGCRRMRIQFCWK